ncbi:MAG: hypothetical protein ACOYEH_00830 [Caldicoprobacterales bacterium]|nr:hypothetical protein [Clostridiales bacterium]
MKKIFLFVLLAVFMSACGQQAIDVDDAVNTEPVLKEPPELIVASKNNKATAILGTYSWSYDNDDGTFTGIEADADIPPKIVHHQISRLNADLNSDVNMVFAKAPEEIKVIIWDNSQIVREVEVKEASFKADRGGNIIYEIYARWDQGSAHYAIRINVQ